jgi:phosphatidylserine/phosphatidylglycerophosphate/cardiolipin synthase-like enzyme
MRFRQSQNGLEVSAVAGTSAIILSFHIDEADTANLMGFAVEKLNHETKEKKWMRAQKHFAPANGAAEPEAPFTTDKHPLQTFTWEDFTVSAGVTYTYSVYPVRGEKHTLGKPCNIEVQAETENGGTHSVYFNRGVAGSFAYAREFHNKKPSEMKPAEQKKAYKWLSRGLFEALEKYIKKAKDSTWKIRAAVYEFEYEPILKLLQARADAGVDVKIVYDSRKEAESNDEAMKEAGVKRKLVIPRKQNPNYISHNKFFILLKNDVPVEVWTGSTNITIKAFFGQCNTGHIVKDKQVAAQYFEYWKALSKDPELKVIKDKTSAIQKDLDAASIPQGVSCFFSPRTKITMAETYAGLVGQAKEMVCGIFPFSFYNDIKEAIKAKSPAIKYAIIDKLSAEQKLKDYDFKRTKITYGTFIKEPFFEWLEEVNSGTLFNRGGNQAIGTNYVHNKVILVDPMGEDPIVITGSANYSKNSTQMNDENTIVIRGDKRAADIYLCEFTRIFQHHYAREMSLLFAKKKDRKEKAGEENPFFLKNNPAEWVKPFFEKNNVKSIRRELFRNMKLS